jgi:hypothetical protein
LAKINSSIGASLRRFVRDVAALAEPETAGIGFENLFGVGRRPFPVLGRDPTQNLLNGWLYLHWKENLGLDLVGFGRHGLGLLSPRLRECLLSLPDRQQFASISAVLGVLKQVLKSFVKTRRRCD